MPDLRAMNARSFRWHETRHALEGQLRACGYDPAALDELPNEDQVCDELARRIRAWRDADEAYTAAEARTSGWRY